MVNKFMTKGVKKNNGGETVYAVNDVKKKNRYLHAKECNWTFIIHKK